MHARDDLSSHYQFCEKVSSLEKRASSGNKPHNNKWQEGEGEQFEPGT